MSKKMTVQHSNDLRESAKQLGCTDEECSQLDNHLAGIDISTLDIAALIQLILQVVALFRKPKPQKAEKVEQSEPAKGSTLPK